MQVKIRVLVGKNLGREIEIDKAKFVIGRGEGCDLRPKTDTVSRQHCALFIKDGLVYARDLGSKNGTTVNAKPIQGDVLLEEGDIVKAGKLEFAMVIERAAATETISGQAAGAQTAIGRAATAPAAAVPSPKATSGAAAAKPGAPKQGAPSGARPAAVARPSAPANVKDAAARSIGRRVDGGQFEDDDIGDWLDEADTDERKRVADPETRQFRMDETDQITLSKPPSSESVAKADSKAAESQGKPGDSNPGKRPGESSADLTAEIKKEKKEPGKLPKMNANSSKDSRAAAEQTLKKFFNRR